MRKHIFQMVKRVIVNVLATTALSIFLMCLVAIIKGFTLMGIFVPFEILLVNLLAHIGFILFDKINMKYKILNYIVMLIYLIGVIVGFGYLFKWFVVNEIWVVCVVGIAVFIIALVIDIIKINRDASEINSSLQELQKRKNQDNKSE